MYYRACHILLELVAPAVCTRVPTACCLCVLGTGLLRWYWSAAWVLLLIAVFILL